MRNQQAAYRYAKSVLEIALDRGRLDEVHADMHMLKDACAQSSDLRTLLRSPVLRADQKLRVLNKAFDFLGQEVSTFVNVLTRKGREALLPEITEAFGNLYHEHKGIVECHVTSAMKLSPAELESVSTLTSTRYPDKTILVREHVDPAIIGGGIVRVGDLQWDASLRNTLHVVRRKFKENPYVPKI